MDKNATTITPPRKILTPSPTTMTIIQTGDDWAISGSATEPSTGLIGLTPTTTGYDTAVGCKGCIYTQIPHRSYAGPGQARGVSPTPG